MVIVDRVKKQSILMMTWIVVGVVWAPGQRLGDDLDRQIEAQRQRQEFFAALQVDRLGRLGVAEYDPQLLALILERLEIGEGNVNTDALHLLRLVLRQWQMPAEALNRISKRVDLVRDENVKGYADDIKWQLSLLQAKSGPAQLTIAKQGLRSGSEWIVDSAIDFLVKVGGDEAKRLLHEAEKVRMQQGLKAKANRIRLGIKRIEVNEEIARRGSGDQLEYVWTMFEEYVKQKPGWGTFEFVLWRLRGLGRRMRCGG